MLSSVRSRRRLLPFAGSLLILSGLLPLGAAVPVFAAGSVSLAAVGVAYTQDFNTLALS